MIYIKRFLTTNLNLKKYIQELNKKYIYIVFKVLFSYWKGKPAIVIF